ncbi:MAG: transporter substrate-binding domain-containing protein [Pseudomonadota bacterium]
MKLHAGIFAMLMCCAARAAAQEVVFIAPTNLTMPMVQFDGRQLTGGLLKDLGDAIAGRLGRRARYIDIPSKRVWAVLAQGEADGVCYVLPEWGEGKLDWTRPLIPDGAVIAAHPSAPKLSHLDELAGHPVGTVLGYRYPELEAALGKDFIRDDAPTMEHNLSKLAAGRRQYAVVELAALEYRLRNTAGPRLRTELVYVQFKARCAFSPRAKVPFAQVEQAIDALVQEGVVEHILEHYR